MTRVTPALGVIRSSNALAPAGGGPSALADTVGLIGPVELAQSGESSR
jgi:hypothetical protein